MKVVILGAGITGLSLGYFLKKKYGDELDLTIVEKNRDSGGYIKTIEKEGFLFELGPRSCRTKGSGISTLKLVEELHLEGDVISEDIAAKNRYIYLNQQMEEVPVKFFSFFRSPLTKGLFWALLRDFFGKGKKVNEDESIHEFALRKFSLNMANVLFDPMTQGIYAGNTRKLSLKSCFPTLYDYEFKYGSLLRGMILNRCKKEKLTPFIQKIRNKSMFSFKGGMQTLTNSLSCTLKKHIIYSTNIKKLECSEDFAKIHLEDETTILADLVFSTISAKKLSLMIDDSELKNSLNQMQSTSVAVVSLGFKKNVLMETGFGYLIPSKEKQNILGVVFDSLVFKEQNRFPEETRLTVMIGGDQMKDFDRYNSEDFLQMAKNAISLHLNIHDKPIISHVEIMKNCIPQYLVGHSKALSLIEQQTPRCLKILGSSFFGVSVNDCIHQAKLHAERELPLQKKGNKDKIRN